MLRCVTLLACILLSCITCDHDVNQNGLGDILQAMGWRNVIVISGFQPELTKDLGKSGIFVANKVTIPESFCKKDNSFPIVITEMSQPVTQIMDCLTVRPSESMFFVTSNRLDQE